MSDTPKFEVIDRRKFKAEHEADGEQQGTSAAETHAVQEQARPEQSSGGPRLVVNEAQPDRASEDATRRRDGGDSSRTNGGGEPGAEDRVRRCFAAT